MSAAERKAARRARLIEAGLIRFGAGGFHGTGVRDICAAAGLTERYFYESFANRQALYVAVYDHCVALIRAGMETAMAEHAHLDPLAVTRVAMRGYLETLRDNPPLVRVLLIDAVAIDADMGRRSVRTARSFTDLIVPVMGERYPSLEGRGLSAQRIADGLVGSTLLIVTQWALSDFDAPLEVILDACMLFYTAVSDALLTP